MASVRMPGITLPRPSPAVPPVLQTHSLTFIHLLLIETRARDCAPPCPWTWQPADELPTVTVDTFLADPTSADAVAECARVADGLHRYGILIVRDARVTEADNIRYGTGEGRVQACAAGGTSGTYQTGGPTVCTLWPCVGERVPRLCACWCHYSFLDMMEQYFEQPEEKNRRDVHEELRYDAGVCERGKRSV